MIESGEILQERYRIQTHIGQGGMGAVYLATDERFGSKVAIKETLCMDASFRKAIEREARLLNSLKHAALPRVTDHFEEKNSQYLVMEFIPGEDLGHILETTNAPFAVDQVTLWADQLLDALDFLHNQEVPVIHRDIKPQNLKTTSDGQIILLDFGLAKGNPTDAGKQTAAKSIFGYSRNYASLEQIQGTGTDPRSDLYSLSATLYHLLTRKPPEDALTRAMAVLGGGRDPLVPAHLLRDDVPKGLAGVLHKSMDLNASGRPSTASEMRKMLNEYDDYAYFVDAEPSYSTVSTATIDASTHAVPSVTSAGNFVGAEALTEIMPAYSSQETAVRAPARIATMSNRPSGRWPRGLAAVLASLLLIGGAAAAGIFYYLDVVGNVPNNGAVEPNPANVPGSAANSAVDAGKSFSDVSANTLASNQADGSSVTNSTGKTAESAKNPKPQQSGKKNPGDETIDIPAPADEDIPGDVVITRKNPDGSTTTTRILKGGKSSPSRPPIAGEQPFPEGIDPRYLTPEQRKKLRTLMRRNANVAIPEPPSQKP